jgi:thymidine kinase
MFSGKTTESLKKVLISRSLFNKTVVVFKPAFDNRYSEIEIVSHDGLKTSAHSVTNAIDVGKKCGTEIDIIDQNIAKAFDVPSYAVKYVDLAVFDEIQFFTEPYFHGDIVRTIQFLLHKRIDVFCSGLDMDWQGNPFDVTAKLCAMADTVHKLKANCFVTGLPASKTYKVSQSGDSVELGALDKYEARSNQHWTIPNGRSLSTSQDDNPNNG